MYCGIARCSNCAAVLAADRVQMDYDMAHVAHKYEPQFRPAQVNAYERCAEDKRQAL
jgi:hypothetical protein